MRIKEVLSNGISILKQFNIEDGTLKAKILLADLLDKSKEYLMIHSDDEIDEKIKQYTKLLNRKSKTLYLILHRHTFKRTGKKMHWIAGMHWL